MYIQRWLEKQVEESLRNHKVLFILGARQVGKTTLIEHLLLNRKKGAVVLNMDIDVDRDRLLSAAKLAPREAVRSLGGSKVLVIDEAQRIPQIGRITKGWYDARVQTKIILLGSSSVALLNNAAAELAGRNEKLWLTPLLLAEIIQQQQWFNSKIALPVLQRDFAGQIKAILLNGAVFGGYPEAHLSDNPVRYLTNLNNDYLLKDLFTTSLVRLPSDVQRLLLELASRLGETVSIAQLATRLQLSRQTVQRYLDLLEGIFVIFGLPAFCTDSVREVNKSYKYYFWDTGVKNSLQREWTVSDRRSDMSVLWENWVIAEVMKQSLTFTRQEDLFFWQSRNGSRVELVVKQGEKLHPFNVKFYPHAAKPSRAFANAYGVEPKIIHPGNVLEFLL